MKIKASLIIWYIKESVKQKAFTHGFANNTMEVEDVLKAIDEGYKNYIEGK
jgi:hypothetical protein